MKKIFLAVLFLTSYGWLYPQEFTPGWEGEAIVPDGVFLNTSAWIRNQSDLMQGDSCFVTADSVLHLHWRFGSGIRPKFAQCYQILSSPADLSGRDIIGIDVRGLAGKAWVRNVELKFESGGAQAVYTWENLAHLDRWCEKLVVLKKQFSNYQSMNWGAVTVISFAVTMNSSDNTDIQSDEGIVSFRTLVAQSVDSLDRAVAPEPLSEIAVEVLQDIRENAIRAIKSRLEGTGLLTTWLQDGSSWLYGQGLALKALTEEGTWDFQGPVNEYAEAAEKLARFLASHQEEEGYWPRAWNAASGNVIVLLEGDNTVWMGDFPWILGSLACYYRKSGDEMVFPAILKAGSFLYSLVIPPGKVNTMNMVTGQISEVTNYEGYAAVLYALIETGDSIQARNVLNYVMESGWDTELKYWKEGPDSPRPVLLVNTWLASLASAAGYSSEATDALSLAGRLLYTKGPGEPSGFDGIGPVATWYEGTLSYIAASGPGSNMLFNGIIPFINPDGTVPAYNDNLGSVAGIWAVDWPSLDATSWLYFAAAGKSPFSFTGSIPGIFSGSGAIKQNKEDIQIYFAGDYIHIASATRALRGGFRLSLYSVQGELLGTCLTTNGKLDIRLTDIAAGNLNPGSLYIAVIHDQSRNYTKKLFYTGRGGY